METLESVKLKTRFGEKELSVCCGDILNLTEPLDVMTVSAFYRSYAPTPGTMFAALGTKGIRVEELAESPAIDLRDVCGVWLSGRITGSPVPIGRLGCLELSPYTQDRSGWYEREHQILASISAYFRMLEIAAISGLGPIRTVGMTIFGGGNQRISMDLTTIPMLNECFRFLRENETTRRILFLTKNREQAERLAQSLRNSYAALRENREEAAEVKRELVFLSYSTPDRNIADNLCAKLEAAGLPVWYAPRNIGSGKYAAAIVDAISRATKFVVIVSRSSLQSEHVLNEIDLAFQELRRGLRICPLRIDEQEMGPSFRYYLSRQHWMDATLPPLENRLDEFVRRLTADPAGETDEPHSVHPLW